MATSVKRALNDPETRRYRDTYTFFENLPEGDTRRYRPQTGTRARASEA